MLIILDRDGVINHDSDQYIKSADEWLPIDGSLAAIAALKKAGHTVVVATNQSGIARGLYDEKALSLIHDKMQGLLAEYDVLLDGIYYCPHHPDEQCNCRKPAPGLLQQIAKDFDADLSQAVMVGDKLTDVEVATVMNCPAVLVKTGKGQLTLDKGLGPYQAQVFDDLAHWVSELR